jgi:hypothetical protein
MFNNIFHEIAPCLDNVEKYVRAGQDGDDNVIRSCTLHAG